MFMKHKVPIDLIQEFMLACNLIEDQVVMPSMRALWSAGKALEENNLAGYNCAYVAMNHPDKFGEMLYVLMHGTGVGFSVERQYVAELPIIPEELKLDTVPQSLIIKDSKLGWKEAFDWCIRGLYDGCLCQFDYSRIRPKGARLKTFGGRASGPQPLKELIEYTIRTFKGAKGRRLNSLEVYDICCMVANCVVVGGVRRSACISFSNLSDQRLKHAKDGQFWLEHPYRAMSNNSIAYTEKPDSAMFMEEWLNLIRSGSGERGIVNVEAIQRKAKRFNRNDTSNLRLNPCAEAILKDRGLCNLTECVIKDTDTKETIKQKIRSAVLLGCLQSTLTYFPNISDEWEINAEEERLLGVSLTGVCDCKLFSKVNDKTKELLNELREYAHTCASEFAKLLNINVPKQVTLVKPSGTVSQLVNCSSGLHPRYSDYYIRRVRVTRKDPIAKLLIDKGVPYNPEVGQENGNINTLVFDFPIKSPRGSITRNQLTALEQLDYWNMFNTYWCDGNPSVTIYVGEDEWVEVGAWVYKNWKDVCGLSFLPRDNNSYPLAPYEEITSKAYHRACEMYKKVDIDFDLDLPPYELGDTTEGASTSACQGGTCEL
jgi:ribonucleoside-diphosphate reductase alpha chain